ncbi:MAG: SsrA-binding protein SmpB [Bacteroidota bacterium]
MPETPKILIENRRARFEYHFVDTYTAGIMLTGTEIKSIRAGNVNLSDAYCVFRGGELYLRSMFIAEYKHGNQFNHEERRERKLLLKRFELRRLEKKVKEKGLTIVPFQLFMNDRGFAKVDIALAQGKKVYDKRQSIKSRENKRALDRAMKERF